MGFTGESGAAAGSEYEGYRRRHIVGGDRASRTVQRWEVTGKNIRAQPAGFERSARWLPTASTLTFPCAHARSAHSNEQFSYSKSQSLTSEHRTLVQTLYSIGAVEYVYSSNSSPTQPHQRRQRRTKLA
jgi:hypothetical protein